MFEKIKFISSRGFLFNTDIHSINPCSDSVHLDNYNNTIETIEENESLYICSAALPIFFSYFFPKIKNRFILVTGDSDITIKENNYINDDRIIHWFAQNCEFIHPKITAIPIGIDYHTLFFNNLPNLGKMETPEEQEQTLIGIRKEMKHFVERKIYCYSNFHFTLERNADRKIAFDTIPKKCVFYEKEFTKRTDSWRRQTEYAFVISPLGHGMDCHRTWEAILLGCIPVVRTSPLDSLYEGLPVLILDNWEELSETLLVKTVEEFSTRSFCYEKLEIEYWKTNFSFFNI